MNNMRRDIFPAIFLIYSTYPTSKLKKEVDEIDSTVNDWSPCKTRFETIPIERTNFI